MEYVLKSAKLREFDESIYSCAKNNEGKSIFKVELSRNLWKHARRLLSLFFEAEDVQSASESVIAKPILLATFYLCNQEEIALQQTTDEEDEPVSEKVQSQGI